MVMSIMINVCHCCFGMLFIRYIKPNIYVHICIYIYIYLPALTCLKGHRFLIIFLFNFNK